MVDLTRRKMRRSALSGKDNNSPSTSTGSPAPFSGKLAGGGFGTPRFAKDFKPPTPVNARAAASSDLAPRKRKRISYKGQDAEQDDDDYDGKKKKKRDFGEFSPPPEVRKWGKVGTSKPSSAPAKTLTSQFSIPEMRDKKGQVVATRFTAGALGVCRRATPLPRPLHNPFEDHAIVLFDPTVDDVDVQEAATAEAERRRQEQLEAEKTGPHKSLAVMLGLDKKIDPKTIKVPVVIDPKLGRILRPHQIEGVKFLYKACSEKIAAGAMGCIMADEMGLDKSFQSFEIQRSAAGADFDLRHQLHARRFSASRCSTRCCANRLKQEKGPSRRPS